MRKVTFQNPQEAYAVLNRWTQMYTSYETQFHGKEVTKVEVTFEGEQPRAAFVHYQNATHMGVDYLNLADKILLDKPKKEPVDFRFTMN